MRDEEIREAEFAAQPFEQANDPCLHENVQRRRRFVEDDDLRLRCERAGDRDPLALSSGELGGEAIDEVRGEAHLLEQLDELRSSAGQPVHGERQRDARPRGLARIQGRERVLRDKLDRAPLRPGAALPGELGAPVPNAPGRGPIEADHESPERRLAGSGFAYDGERFALRDPERDSVQREDVAVALAQVAGRQQFRHRRRSTAGARSRGGPSCTRGTGRAESLAPLRARRSRPRA